MAVIHAKVSAVSDGGDSSLVQPTDWNAGHTINDIIPAADSTYKLGASGTAWTAVHTEVVSFPATQVASSGANDLDDYQEGDWTPAFSSTGGGAASDTAAYGRYQKVGRWVTISCSIAAYRGTLASGNMSITGLPFAAAATVTDWACAVGYSNGLVSMTGYTVQADIQASTSAILLLAYKDGTSGALTNSNIPTGAPAGHLVITATYETTA